MKSDEGGGGGEGIGLSSSEGNQGFTGNFELSEVILDPEG
jgi:hypothetical protein